ncbi:hypothetical protein MP638_007431, partial [Amoeboaphelidium occidentale]
MSNRHPNLGEGTSTSANNYSRPNGALSNQVGMTKSTETSEASPCPKFSKEFVMSMRSKHASIYWRIVEAYNNCRYKKNFFERDIMWFYDCYNNVDSPDWVQQMTCPCGTTITKRGPYGKKTSDFRRSKLGCSAKTPYFLLIFVNRIFGENFFEVPFEERPIPFQFITKHQSASNQIADPLISKSTTDLSTMTTAPNKLQTGSPSVTEAKASDVSPTALTDSSTTSEGTATHDKEVKTAVSKKSKKKEAKGKARADTVEYHFEMPKKGEDCSEESAAKPVAVKRDELRFELPKKGDSDYVEPADLSAAMKMKAAENVEVNLVTLSTDMDNMSIKDEEPMYSDDAQVIMEDEDLISFSGDYDDLEGFKEAEKKISVKEYKRKLADETKLEKELKKIKSDYSDLKKQSSRMEEKMEKMQDQMCQVIEFVKPKEAEVVAVNAVIEKPLVVETKVSMPSTTDLTSSTLTNMVPFVVFKEKSDVLVKDVLGVTFAKARAPSTFVGQIFHDHVLVVVP